MNTRRQFRSTILLCIAEAAVGILLLLHPVRFTTAIITVVGAALIVGGILNVVRYFKSSPEEAALGGLLGRGLISLAAGAFCAFNPQWFLAAFPVVAILYGVLVLLAGLTKVQFALDLFRLKVRMWWWSALSAVLSILCALIIIRNPFSSMAVLWWFAGISLIVEAVFDLVALLMGRRGGGGAPA